MSVVVYKRDFLEKIPKEEREAFENIFPNNKYPLNEKMMINLKEWNLIKLDYEEKIKDYYGFIQINNSDKEEYDQTYINYYDIIKNCPRIMQPLEFIREEEEENIENLLEISIQNNSNIQIIEINSLLELEEILLKESVKEKEDEEVNIDILSKELSLNKVFYNIKSNVYNEICDFKFMNKFLLKTQTKETIPYNKCLAIFMIFYYMRNNYLCIEFIKNMELIIGNFHGLLDMRELMLKLHFHTSIIQEDIISNEKLLKLTDGFPNLIDMKLSYYKFNVTEDGHKISLCFSTSKSFYMNKITYSTFAEHFENMNIKKLKRYHQFRLSMLYTFKLIIPDQENFDLAKSIGFIDSNRIDWKFWKENVVKYPFFIHQNNNNNQDFLIKRQYDLLRKMKNRYYNFFLNLYTDYHRSFVHDPVSLVFNIAAVIFAMTGVISVLQNSGIIPSRKD